MINHTKIMTQQKTTQLKDEDDLIIGTPFGTYVLRAKGTSETTGTHTPGSGAQDKDKTPQRNTTIEDLFI